MAVIKLNGAYLTDLGGTLERGSLEFVKTRKEPDTASFNCFGYKPVEESVCEVWNDSETSLMFAGVIKQSKRTRVGSGPSRGTRYAVTVGGMSHLLQRHLIMYRFAAQTAGACIREAVALYDADVDTSGVEDGPELPAFSFVGYPLELVEKLAALTGYGWRVNANKELIFAPRGTTRAPEDLSDENGADSLNFEDLEINVESSQIRNVVEVIGGTDMYPTPVTELFNGTGTEANFRLSYKPFSNKKNPLLKDTFTPAADYEPNSQYWSEHDVTNPSPPNQSDPGKAPIVGTDGYIIVDNFRLSIPACQFVGGPGSYGTVGLLSKQAFERTEDRYYYAWFYFHSTTGEAVLGWFDGIGVSNTDCLYGVEFTNGTIHAYVNGARSALMGRSYTTATDYAIRLTVKAAGGCKIDIIGGSYGTWAGRNWTTLLDTATGNSAFLYAGVANKSANFSLHEIRVSDPVLSMTVKVGGVKQVVEVDNVSTAQCDCLVNVDNRLVKFFTDNKPAAGTENVEITYYPPLPIHVSASDPNSIDLIKALTGETGTRAGWRHFLIEDETLETREAAENRAEQEVEQFGQPLVSANWKTWTDGYEPDQIITIYVPKLGVTQDFLIEEVHFYHLGEDDWRYEISAGSSLKGPDDYLVALIQRTRRVLLDENASLSYLITGDEKALITESKNKLTMTPDIEGNENASFTEALLSITLLPDISGAENAIVTETLDYNTLQPPTANTYGTAKYGMSIRG